MENNSLQPKRFLKLPIVKDRTGKSRSGIYADIKEEKFPKPINLGGNSVGWLESEIDAWIEERIAVSRSVSYKIKVKGKTSSQTALQSP